MRCDERRFEEIYNAMEDFFYSDTVTFRFVAPLPFFEMDSNCIELGDQFSLIRLSTKDREQLVQVGFGSTEPWAGFTKCGLELVINEPKVFNPPQMIPTITGSQATASKEFMEAISALRLFRAGFVGYLTVHQNIVSWFPLGGTLSMGVSNREIFPASQRYKLLPEEVAKFSSFWQQYRQARLRKQPRTDIALRRLNFGYERIRHEDKLIDYMIGLEALLTRKGGEGSDLTYRIALRGARLLGSDATHRMHIHAELVRAYRLRSEIVHGSEIEFGQNVAVEQETIAFGDFVERIAQHLREAIKKFMARTADTRELEVIKALDHEAITAN